MLRPFMLAVVCAGWVTLAGTAAAAPPSQELLPKTTVGYLSVGNWETLSQKWSETQLAELINDPVMKPFVDDLQAQLEAKWTKSHTKLGVHWGDLKDLPRGEVALAMIYSGQGQPAVALLADVTGNVDAGRQFLDDLVKRLEEQGAKRSERKVGDHQIVVLDFPKQEGDDHERQSAYSLAGELFVAADNLAVVQGILGRLDGGAKDTLSTVEAYQHVNQACASEAGEVAPHVRWFVEPFGFADGVRAGRPERKQKSTDIIKVLKNQGFTAVRGAGGFVNLATQGYEILHRTKVYAPKPYELAMRMAVLPNERELSPQKWVPLDVASYATLHVDIQNAFERFSTMFDELFGEGEKGVFEDVLESIKTDENGPMVDIRHDIVARLGSRVSIISDYRLPVTVSSQRRVIAVEIKEGETDALAETIAKSMRPDPTAKERKFRDQTIWEIVPEEDVPPPVELELEIEGADLGAEEEMAEGENAEEDFALPNSAICVAHGHMFMGTHVDVIEKVLAKFEDDQRLLSETPDFQQVYSQMGAVHADGGCALVFSRTDEEMRANYELLKAGKMPESETGMGRILNALLAPDAEPNAPPREAEIDASKLPDYQVVRRYLGPSGAFVKSVDDGWFIVGMLLRKEPSSESPAEPAAAPELNANLEGRLQPAQIPGRGVKRQ
ncbi:MAG: hypothetical protein K1X74_15210 [Pirellulales bacterium]|nr:hypothetical protein [Pirellulales bacterium]